MGGAALQGEPQQDMNPERGWGGWGAPRAGCPSVTPRRRAGSRAQTRVPPRPQPCSTRSLPPAPSPSACAASPSLSPLSSARHGSSKMSAAPRPPLSPARPGAAPLARKISAAYSTANTAGSAPEQTLTTLKLPPPRPSAAPELSTPTPL